MTPLPEPSDRDHGRRLTWPAHRTWFSPCPQRNLGF